VVPEASERGLILQDAPDRSPKVRKRDFWSEENLKYTKPHFRLEKCARIVNKIAAGREFRLLDVGCGPAALRPALQPDTHYNGIDMAIQQPAPKLLEADLIESPVSFEGNIRPQSDFCARLVGHDKIERYFPTSSPLAANQHARIVRR
jgi:hypothetical protein